MGPGAIVLMITDPGEMRNDTSLVCQRAVRSLEALGMVSLTFDVDWWLVRR